MATRRRRPYACEIACATCNAPTPHKLDRNGSGEEMYRCQRCYTWSLAKPFAGAKPRINPSLRCKLPPQAILRRMAEYEGRLFAGGAYSYARRNSRMLAKDAPIKKVIDLARINYNKLRLQIGLTPVTNWAIRPEKTGEEMLRRLLINPSPRAEISRAVKLADDFSGHRPTKAIPVRRPAAGRVRLAIGPVTAIQYVARRDGEVNEYRHTFASHSRPQLVVSPDGKRLELLGGAFRFTERGIVDKPMKRRNR